MGGSVVVRTCPMLLERKYKVAGTAVLDVVEGTNTPFLSSIPALTLNKVPLSRLYLICIVFLMLDRRVSGVSKKQ